MNFAEAKAAEAALQRMQKPDFDAYALEKKKDPILFPLIFQEGLRRAALDRQKAMDRAASAKPAVNDQVLMAMSAPEDAAGSGIAQLPAGDMNYADGGIVAFAGGGYNEAGDAGRLEILAQEMRQAQQRLAQGDMRAQGDIEALTREIGRIKKTPSLASQITSALPLGSAQAGSLPPPTGQIAPAATTDSGYTPEGLEALGQRLDTIREARAKAKPPSLRERQADPEAAARYQALLTLNRNAQREYEKYAENIYNKPAFAASSAGGKSVGTTTLPAAQEVAKKAAAPDIAAQETRRSEPKELGAGYGDPLSAVDFQASPAKELSPKQEKQIIAAAKESVPEGTDTKGWTSEDWLTLGFGLLGSKAPRFAEAAGEAGLKVLAGRQAREKTGLEALKTKQDIESSKALARKYGAEAARYEAEDRPLAQMRKEIAAAYLKLESDAMLKLDPAKLAAEKRRVASEIMANYPELADTIGAGAATGIAAPQGVKVTRIGP